MDTDALATVAFAVGTAGNLAKGVPQFVRTAVRGHVSGLSAGAVWFAVIANAVWASFGAAISDMRFFTLSLLGLLLTMMTALRFVTRTGWGSSRALCVVTIACNLGFVVLALMRQPQALAVLGVAIGLVVSVPQLRHLLRMRNTRLDVSGVSVTEFVVVIIAQVAWASYWLLNHQWLVAAGAAWGGVARALSLALLLQQLRRSHSAVHG